MSALEDVKKIFYDVSTNKESVLYWAIVRLDKDYSGKNRNFIEDAAAELAALERVAEAAKMIEKISKTIFVVSQKAGTRLQQVACPHGNIPTYPSHAWWCDGCFQEFSDAQDELSDALAELEKARL